MRRSLYNLFTAFIFSSCFSLFAFAQTNEIDSLSNILKTAKEDTNKLNNLNILCKKLYLLGYYIPADSFANKALQLAQNLLQHEDNAVQALSDKNYLATAYKNKGNIFFFQANYPEALKNQSKALSIFQETSNKQGISSAIGNIASIHYKMGDFKASASGHLQAMKIDEQIGNKQQLYNDYSNLGNDYIQMGNYPEALSSDLQSLKLAREIGDKENICAAYNNLGGIYNSMGNFADALKAFLQALAIAQENGSKQDIGNCYVNIGVIYGNFSDYPKALSSQLKALAIFQDIDDKYGMGFAFLSIGGSYFGMNDYSKALESFYSGIAIDKSINNNSAMVSSYLQIGGILVNEHKNDLAKKYLDSSLTVAKKMGDKVAISIFYKNSSALSANIGNYKAAYLDYINYITYRDSLKNDEYTKKLVSEQMQFDFDQKQAAQKADQDKKDLSTAAESNRQRVIILLIASLAVTLALALYIIFNSLKNTRKEKLLVEKQKVLVELQALRAQMNPHFIFNAINSIKQFIFENDAESADRHLSRFATLIRKILENSTHETITLEEELKMLELYIQLEMLRFSPRFTYKIIVSQEVETEKVLISPLIVQPYVENAIWHGLMHQEKQGELILKFEKVHKSSLQGEGLSGADEMLKCTIDDNGIGRQRSAEIKKNKQHKSVGLSITKERLEIVNMLYNINMNIKFTDKQSEDGSSAGTKVELFMPYTTK